MATEICLTIEDDGTFSVGTEDAQAEATEDQGTGQGAEGGEDEGNEQQFKTLAEALAAVKQLAQSATMGPEQAAGEEDQGGEDETGAMMGAFKPKGQGL